MPSEPLGENRWERLRDLPPAEEAASHFSDADDPLDIVDLICAGCQDDWPCDFERGRRSVPPAAQQPRTSRATLTLSPTFGPAIWLDGRLVARISASVEDSRITPEEPEPRWKRDAMFFVDAVNATPEPTLDAERLAWALGSTGNCGHSSCPRDTSRHDDEARDIAAEYARLSAPTDGGD